MTTRDAIDTAIAKLEDGGKAASWDRQAAAVLLRYFPAGQAQDDMSAQLDRLLSLGEAAGLRDAVDFVRMQVDFLVDRE